VLFGDSLEAQTYLKINKNISQLAGMEFTTHLSELEVLESALE
jgi:hypothetical protein